MIDMQDFELEYREFYKTHFEVDESVLKKAHN